jgi:hypothetical protein
MDLFSGNNLIDIDVHYVVEKNKAGYPLVNVITEDRANALRADEKTKDSVKTLKTKWRPQTWQAANDLLQKATMFNFHTQQQDIDWTKYRDARLKACLVEWDAKTDKGEPVPCVEAYINKLHATVALALLEKYDDATSVDKEDVQKN